MCTLGTALVSLLVEIMCTLGDGLVVTLRDRLLITPEVGMRCIVVDGVVSTFGDGIRCTLRDKMRCEFGELDACDGLADVCSFRTGTDYK